MRSVCFIGFRFTEHTSATATDEVDGPATVHKGSAEDSFAILVSITLLLATAISCDDSKRDTFAKEDLQAFLSSLTFSLSFSL